MANKQHAQFSDENGNLFYLESETEDVLDPSGKPLSNGGDLSEASVTFTPDATRKLPQSGGRFKAFLGSIVKYLTDLGAAAYLAVANNCTTTQAGSLLDARQGKVLMDKANQLSSETDRIRVYVGSDGKLHFVNKAGADSVLPFSSFKFGAAVPYNPSRTPNGDPIPFDLSAYSGEVIIAFAFIWAYGVSLGVTEITFSPEPEEYLYKAPDAYTMGGSWGYNVPFVIRINVDQIANKTLYVNHKSNGQMRGCQYFIFQI